MFPPEEIAAAQAREAERDRALARRLAAQITALVRTEDEVRSVEPLEIDPSILHVELVDGTEFMVMVVRTE